MAHEIHLKNSKYRQWVKAGLGLGYLKEGLAPFCDDIGKQQHKDIIKKIQGTKTPKPNVPCGVCQITSLQPDHVRVSKGICPLKQDKCNCCFPNNKKPCPNNICGAIYDSIIQNHASIPPAPFWRNSDAHDWSVDPWSICKCFINAPGYKDKTSAVDVDCSGLLHVIINNKYFHNHIGCNVTGPNNLFAKVRQYRNEIFHSSSMELEETEANSYIEDMISVLQDGKELIHHQAAQLAVGKLHDLKRKAFIITTDGFEEVLRQIKEEMTKILQSTENAATKEEYDELKNKLYDLETQMAQEKEEKQRLKVQETAHQKQLEYEKAKSEFKDGLIEFYKTRHSKVFLSPLFEENDTPLASFYIRPELNSAPTGNDEKTHVTSLFEILKTGNQANRELHVIADAGLGKTAFSNYLAITWCQAHFPDENMAQSFEKDDIDCMQGFDFLFLVLLRDSNDLCSIDDLIFKNIVSNLGLEEKPSEDFLLKILKNEKCLVILDGLDEWTHPEKECHRSPKSIPHRNDRERCTILTTMRPWKLGVLNLNSCQIGKKVELTKLSYDSAVTLTERILQRLKSHSNKDALQRDVTEFISGIKSRQNDELTSVPLLLIYTICLWCDGVQIGNSKWELYINIVELLLSRTIKKHGDLKNCCVHSDSDIPECFAEYENSTKYYPLLICLGKLAYYTLFNETRENTLVFDGSVARKYITPDEMLKFTLHSGMLSESTTKTFTKKFSKVSFSHKTVQEFFAAIFINSQSDAHKTVVEKCRNVQDILDMSKICEFISKMNADRMCEISNDLMPVINEDEITRDYRTRTGYENLYNNPLYDIQEMFMSCLQEMPESENIQLFLQDFIIDKNTVYSEQLQRLLKQNKTNIKSLYIDIKNTSTSLPEIIDLFSLTDLSHIQNLYYEGGEKEEAEITRILFPSLQNVTLRDGEWTNDEENLSENLARLQNLHYLYIESFTLSHKILETLFNFISGQKSMKELTLEGLDCKEHGWHHCKRLNLDLSQHSTLSKCFLRWLPGRLQLNISTPSLVDDRLWGINLDENSLLLSCDMLNIERVEFKFIEMSAGSLQNLITVLENLPQSVTVVMSDIKPYTEYESVRNNIRSSQTFHVTQDCWRFEFKTIKPSKE